MSKILVVYYSHSGNTKIVGELIGKVLGAETLEISPVKEYTGSMWDVVEQWREEYSKNLLRDITEYNLNLDDYKTIIIGSPNWGNTIATPIKTFIDQNSFKDKDVVPFLTHGGGGEGHMAKDIYKFTGVQKTYKALSIKGSNVNEQIIKNWVIEIGLNAR